MNIEEAIKTALEYEGKIRRVYKEAADGAKDEDSKRIFSLMMKEEQYHIDYLSKRLEEWKQSGKIEIKKVHTTVPSADIIKKSVDQIEDRMSNKDYSDEILILRKALDLEIETSGFYRKMVEELPEEYRRLFKGFLEIEEGHKAVVQAEIDFLQGGGYWYQFPEFDLEVE